MRKLFVVLLTVTVCVAMPLMAQDKEMAKKENMAAMHAPPPPLDNEYMSWMVGEWKGWSETAMGKSEVSVKCEMAFGGQFMMTQYKGESPMGEFSGGGIYTLNQEGGIEAFWVDSMREMAHGKVRLEWALDDASARAVLWAVHLPVEVFESTSPNPFRHLIYFNEPLSGRGRLKKSTPVDLEKEAVGLGLAYLARV